MTSKANGDPAGSAPVDRPVSRKRVDVPHVVLLEVGRALARRQISDDLFDEVRRHAVAWINDDERRYEVDALLSAARKGHECAQYEQHTLDAGWKRWEP